MIFAMDFSRLRVIVECRRHKKRNEISGVGSALSNMATFRQLFDSDWTLFMQFKKKPSITIQYLIIFTFYFQG